MSWTDSLNPEENNKFVIEEFQNLEDWSICKAATRWVMWWRADDQDEELVISWELKTRSVLSWTWQRDSAVSAIKGWDAEWDAEWDAFNRLFYSEQQQKKKNKMWEGEATAEDFARVAVCGWIRSSSREAYAVIEELKKIPMS